MPELTPLEKLQPCLLDRLTDDEPEQREESRTQRVVSLSRYKRGLLRDIEWLFNASAHLPEEGREQFKLSDFPEAFKSVLNFGSRHLCGLIAPDMQALERELTEAIRLFEPRIIRKSVVVKATKVRHLIALEIHGELWANPVPEQLYLKTTVDLETGQAVLGAPGNG